MADVPPQVVLGLDGLAAHPAVEAAALLAERLGADVNALFVEDEELLRLAQLPFSALIAHTGTIRDLDLETMERSERATAVRLRNALAQAARQSKVRWTFRVCRGRLLGELSSLGSGDDLVVIPTRGLTRRALGFGTVAALLDETTSTSRVLDLLDTLAPLGPALLLMPAGTPAAILEQALGWVERRRDRARVSRTLGVESGDVADTLRGENPALLVMPRGSHSLDRPTLRALRERASCPLLVVR